MRRTVVLPLVWLFLFESSASAREDSPREEEDYRHAVGLADRGYFDLASDLAASLESETSALARAAIARRRASRAPAFSVRLDLYRSAIEGLLGFLERENPSAHPLYFEALCELGDASHQHAEAALDSRGVEAGHATDTRSGAATLLARAQERLREGYARLDRLDSNAATDLARMRLRFHLAVGAYTRARFLSPSTTERSDQFRVAARKLEAFAWEYAAFRSGEIAWLYLGKAYADWSHDAPDRARELSATALDLFEGVVVEASRAQEPRGWAASLVQRAFFERMRLLVSMGRRREAIDAGWGLIALFDPASNASRESTIDALAKATWIEPFGYAALIDLANAHEAEGDRELASRLLSSLAAHRPDPRTRQVLERRLAQMVLARDGHAYGEREATPEALFLAGKGLWLEGRWNRSIELFQRMLRATETTGRYRDRAAEAWFWIGRCYTEMDDHLAARIAHEAGSSHELGSSSDFARQNEVEAGLAEARHRARDSRAVDKKSRRPATPFVREARRAPRDRAADAFDGRSAYDEGLAEMDAGDFASAIRRFESVHRTHPRYPRSRLRLGECRLELGRRALASGDRRRAEAEFAELRRVASGFDSFVRRDSRERGGRATSEQRQAMAALLYSRAQAERAAGHRGRALACLHGVTRRFPDQSNFVEGALYVEIDLHLEHDDLAAARKVLVKLEAVAPDSRSTIEAHLAIGRAFKRAFARRVAASAMEPAQVLRLDDEARDLLRTSVDHRIRWWERRGRPTRTALEVASDLIGVGDRDRARELLVSLRELREDVMPESDRRALLRLLADLYLEEGRSADAVPLYRELVDATARGGSREELLELRRRFAIALGGTLLETKRGGFVEIAGAPGADARDEARSVWGQIVGPRIPSFRSDEWWEARFHLVYLRFRAGDVQGADEALVYLENRFGEELDWSAMRGRFGWLRSRLDGARR